MKKYYYKVTTMNMLSFNTGDVRNRDGIRSRTWDRLNIKYDFGKWIKPRIENSEIFIFGTKKEAITFADECEFCDMYRHYRIFKCLARKPKVRCFMASLSSDDVSRIKSYWCNVCGVASTSTPLGTYTAKEIKLIKEVSDGIKK